MSEQFAVDPKEFKDAEKVEFRVHVEVIGEKEGKAIRYEYTCACEMNPATGLSASYGAQVVAHAKEKMTGIVARSNTWRLNHISNIWNQKALNSMFPSPKMERSQNQEY